MSLTNVNVWNPNLFVVKKYTTYRQPRMALYALLMISLISKVSWRRVKVEESDNFLEEIWWAWDTNLAKRENIQTKERQIQAKEMIDFTKF